MIDSMNMAMVRHRVSGGRLMCAGVVVTLVGIALGLMATYEIPGHWTTAVVGVAVLLGGALRHLLARHDRRERGAPEVGGPHAGTPA
jgi:hypothetical protein